MNFKSKRGITVTSIMVYVLLFFAFTTIATVISSRFNKNLFNDRGNAINVTAINKLEYNLLNSASNSYNVDMAINGNNRTLTFSNSDVYVFDNDNNVIYKNGGKLVKFLKESSVKIQENIINIDVVLNKYTNEVSRNIKIKCASNVNTESYLKTNLLAQLDGIRNVDLGHDPYSLYWQDISGNNIKQAVNDYLSNTQIEKYWQEDGFRFFKKESDSQNERVGIKTFYPQNTYSTITCEFTITLLSQLGTGGSDYVYPFFVAAQDGTTSVYFGIRKNVALMYGSGNNTVFNTPKINIEEGKTYTFTFVQENLTTRSVYVNGKFILKRTGLTLSNITSGKLYMQNHANGSYIIHSVRVYDKALTESEILQNYNVDAVRFGN